MSRYIDADRIDWRLIISTNATTAEENMIYRARKLVESQPTADVVEVVHGEWLEKEVFDNTDEDFVWKIEEWQSARCSVCGKYHTTPYMYYFDNFNYCPNCGARMDGVL